MLGVAVAVLAVVALGQPQGKQAAKAALTPSSSPASLSPEVSTSAATSASRAPSSSTANSSSSAVTTTNSSATANPKAVPLIVLNATNKNGLAASATHTFQAGGWTVASQGNLTNNILSTCAYYDPSDPRNQAAAQALMTQFPAIKRIKEKFDGLPAGPIVVVLTADYS